MQREALPDRSTDGVNNYSPQKRRVGCKEGWKRADRATWKEGMVSRRNRDGSTTAPLSCSLTEGGSTCPWLTYKCSMMTDSQETVCVVLCAPHYRNQSTKAYMGFERSPWPLPATSETAGRPARLFLCPSVIGEPSAECISLTLVCF